MDGCARLYNFALDGKHFRKGHNIYTRFMTPKIKLGDRIDLLDVKNFSRCISSLAWWNRILLTLNAVTNMRSSTGKIEMSENGIFLIDINQSSGSHQGGNITVSVCDQSTRVVKRYKIYGEEL